jgi:hypothetical protein
MKQNMSSFILGLFGGLALYAGVLSYQHSQQDSLNQSHKFSSQQSFVLPTNQQQPSTADYSILVADYDKLQLRCNDYEHDISSLLLVSEELFDVDRTRQQIHQRYASSDSLHREELLLGVYDVLQQKNQNLLTPEYVNSFEEGLVWLQDTY